MSNSQRRWMPLGLLAVVVVLLLPAVREIFIIEGLRWLYIFLVSFSLSLVATPLTIQFALRWGLVDHPAARKVHDNPTPRIGGLAIYLGFVASVLINSILADWMGAILLAGT